MNCSLTYLQCKDNNEGKCSSYIPTLEQAGEEKWGVSVCTIDGQRFSIGDADDAFTMQAIGYSLKYNTLKIYHNLTRLDNLLYLILKNSYIFYEIYRSPILYAKCLNELGLSAVHKYQGREPSGRKFNEIALDHRSKFQFIQTSSSEID